MELEELYEQIQPRIYAFFYVKTWDREAAEDLTHEVFYEALKGGSSFAGASSAQTWMFGIAKNVLKKYFRSKKYKDHLPDMLANEEEGIPTPEEQLLIKEEKNRLLAAIHQLDDLSKEVVILRTYGELSFKEIGELLGKSENYARVTFHRAKLKLHTELEGDHG